ncbi:MAG: FAD-dependent oxidoreductase [Deltaproteobacteria bacterium]|nr:FAD-dependent oxidoreductase [Deltaproteobacteria bacterium]
MERVKVIQKLKAQSYDLLVIGGGATGCGIALDAASRGLQVALVERDDFSSGTSSKSTKLFHGGVRYLEQAVKKLDKGQYHLVREALHERATLLKIASHLSRPIAIMTPLYKWYEGPYYRIGLKMYDWVAGKTNLFPSRWMKMAEAKKEFPLLKSRGLKGGVVYADGQFDDSRMNLAIALTAIEQGASLANHIEVVQLLKENDLLVGAQLKDKLSSEVFEVRAKVIINATGPFADQIRKMDDPHSKPILSASSGVHIIVDSKFCPPNMGLLIPKTDDGRVIFFLPWLDHTLVGTTDNPAKIEMDPKPSEEDIQYILHQVKKYLGISISRTQILSAWSGLRPLVSQESAENTAGLSRDHVIVESKSGLITITGGKWTTYRKMALDAVNHATKLGELTSTESRTQEIPLVGAKKFHPKIIQELQKKYQLAPDIAKHLGQAYGDRAEQVIQIAQEGYAKRLHERHPHIEAEILYALRYEMAQTVTDVLARRVRLYFLDQNAARLALPRVLQLMSQEASWDEKRLHQEEKLFLDYMKMANH